MTVSVIFDLDGTLIDSVPDIHAAVARMLAGKGVPPPDLATITSFVGNGLPMLCERVIGRCGLDRADHSQLVAALLQDYTKTPPRLTRLYPRVVAALQSLRAAGHTMGICTNKPLAPALAILSDLGLSGFFAHVTGGDSLPHIKPDPAPLHACIAALGGGPAVFVGDSEVDVQTALRAAVPFLLFTEGYRKSPVAEMPATAHFNDFADLPELVAAL